MAPLRQGQTVTGVPDESSHSPSTCPTCRTPIPSDSSYGVCPSCILQLALPSAPEPTINGERLGPYELVRELGRGGFGVVYSARDTRTHEEVAIKVLHDQAGAEARCRFATEVISTGLLKHPHIVRLLDSGTDGERDWYAMELIHGSTLLERVRAGLPKPATAARWLADLAGAVAHAHSHKIVHRDLKPANVLIGGSSGVYLTDFGLAKSLGPALRASLDLELSLTGGLIGTAGYMAPEQARGDSSEQGYATDIYGLGTILYQCLTGRPPFVHENLSGILRLIETEEPVSPQKLNPNVPIGLESICLKCLEKQPGDRYASVSDLAADLTRFLDGKETEARPQPMRVRLFRWARRQPVAAGLAGALIVAVAGGMGGITWQYRKTLGAYGRLAEVRDRQTIELATSLQSQGRTGAAVSRLARAVRENPSNRGAVALLAALIQDSAWPLPEFELGKSTIGAELVAISPDGRFIATLHERGNGMRGIGTWDLSERSATAEWTVQSESPTGFGFSSDSSAVLLKSTAGISAWLVNGTRITPTPAMAGDLPDPPEELDWIPGTNAVSLNRRLRRVAVDNGSWNLPAVSLLDLDSRLPVRNALNGEQLPTHGGYDPSNVSGMFVTTLNNTLRWRDGSRGDLVGPFLEMESLILDAAWAPSGRWLAVGSLSAPVSAWTLSPAAGSRPAWTNASQIRSLRFSPTGDSLAISTVANSTTCLDPGGTETRLDGAWISTWFPDNERIALAGQDGVLQVKRPKDPSWVGPRIELPKPIDAIAVSPDLKWLAAATQDQMVHVWDASTGKPMGGAIRLLQAGGASWGIDRVFALQFSPDSQILAAAAASIGALIDIPRSTITYRFDSGTPCSSTAISRDGRWAAFGTMSQRIAVVATSPAPTQLLELQEPDEVLSVAFSSDGKRLVSGGERGSVRVYAIPGGNLLHDLATEGSSVPWVDFSPDGSRLVALTHGGEVWLWDAESGVQLGSPRKLTDRKLTRGHFSPDGRRLAIGSIGGHVWVLDLVGPGDPPPDWLPDLGECLAGQRFNSDGTWERVPVSEKLALRKRLGAASPSGSWGEWTKRFQLPGSSGKAEATR